MPTHTPMPDREAACAPHAARDRFAAVITVILVAFTVSCIGLGHRPADTRPDTTCLININTADAAELQLLPGVGPAIAERIVSERAVRPFRDASEVTRVRGIGPKRAARIEPYILTADRPPGALVP